jgi:hypothetical protein
MRDIDTDKYLIKFRAESLGRGHPIAFIRFGANTLLPDSTAETLPSEMPDLILINDSADVGLLEDLLKPILASCKSASIVFHTATRGNYEKRMTTLCADLQPHICEAHHNSGDVYTFLLKIADEFRNGRRDGYDQQLSSFADYCQQDDQSLRLSLLHQCLASAGAKKLLSEKPLPSCLLEGDIKSLIEQLSNNVEGPFAESYLEIVRQLRTALLEN